MSYIIRMGQVEFVEPMGASSQKDACCGMRIKARLSQDNATPTHDLPYCFPLLPKMIQTAPKVGECVLVLYAEPSNPNSNRYFIGPVISQPQKMEMDNYNHGRGSAISLLGSGGVEPMETISNYTITNGSFPKEDDVAIIGRVSEDIILRDREIDIRCGIRGKSTKLDDTLKGNVIFNESNPSYIQLKYKNGQSNVNIVADNINLVSHSDKNKLNGNITLTDNESLITDDDLAKLSEQLHPIPHGDELVDILKKVRDAITQHVHPWPGLPACLDYSVSTLNDTDFSEMLSDNIKIS